jgi:hypothetical protein
MADLTLLDYTKTLKPSAEQSILELYSLSSHPLMAMPIVSEPTGVCKYNMELDISYTGSDNSYREFGDEFSTFKTAVQPFVNTAKIAGSRIQSDRAAQKINPAENKRQILGQIKSLARQMTIDIFEGTGGKGLYGMSSMIGDVNLPYTGQVVDALDGVITPDILDDALAKHNIIGGSTYFYMNDVPLRKVKKDSRGIVSGGYNIQYRPEENGVFAGMYDNIPIIATKDGKGINYLSVESGTPDTTSIYIVTYGVDNFHAFHVAPAEILNLDNISVKNAFDLEWIVGTVAKNPRCITKIKNVKNAIA